MKVLLLEDQPEVGQLIFTFLQKWNMDALYVQSAEEAWETLQEGSFDLLITDLSMPGMTGMELIQKLRQTDQHSGLPILVISGKAQKEDIVELARHDVHDFMAKPFHATALQKKIRTIQKTQDQRARGKRINRIWKERTTFLSEVKGPLIILGEPVDSIEELRRPNNRELVGYLDHARTAVAQTNADNPSLDASYVIEHNTTNIIVYLKKHATQQRVKLLLISPQCRGNPLLIVRLFTINRKEDLPVFLVCKHPDEISETHREGLKRLGVKTIRRANLDRGRIQKLLDKYVVGKLEKIIETPAEEAPAPEVISQRIRDDIEAMTSLPPLPQVYQKISSLAKDPQSKLTDWGKIIKLDPMTCATILRHANSISSGFKGDITEIERAVVLLGKNSVAGLVASEAMRQAFAAVQEKGFNLEDFWLHNLAVGFAAYLLSCPLNKEEAAGGQTPDVATLGLEEENIALLKKVNLPRRLKLDLTRENPFMGGIMHDIGKGIMVHSYPGLFPLILAELKKNDWKIPMLAAEQEVAGDLSHPAVGEILLRNWGMPDEICNVVLRHHQPDFDDSFCFLIGIADVIGQMLYPFPFEAEYPLTQALGEGATDLAKPFLPADFLNQPLLRIEDFMLLVDAVSPRVKFLVEKMRLSVQ
jgi:HD-like signal output (HDOD) protein/DNA-binding response OmpR family regulator